MEPDSSRWVGLLRGDIAASYPWLAVLTVAPGRIGLAPLSFAALELATQGLFHQAGDSNPVY